MACACEQARKGDKCAWCKEAIAHNIPPRQRKCQWGNCS